MKDRNLFKGKIKGEKTGHEELDWAVGNLVEECRQVMEKMKPKSWVNTLCDVWVRLFHEDWLK